MLSGECANGDYPLESVQTMQRTLKQADMHLRSKDRLPEGADIDAPMPDDVTQYEVLARAAVHAARDFDAPLIIVLTRTGNTARLVAKYRPAAPVMAFMDELDAKVCFYLPLHFK